MSGQRSVASTERNRELMRLRRQNEAAEVRRHRIDEQRSRQANYVRMKRWMIVVLEFRSNELDRPNYV